MVSFQPSSVANVFFSDANLGAMHQAIRYRVWVDSDRKLVIGRQSEDQLVFVMRSVFLTDSCNREGNQAVILEQHKNHMDAGVLLRQLCVVDVDNENLVKHLEEIFPILNHVPTEITRAGRQYWFLRSALAEEEEYYDGPAQRIPGVDFKSVAATGTSGFVVIAPSKGKKWIRPLAYARILHPCDNTIEHCKKLKNALVHIPDEILKYVATSCKEKMKAAEEASNKKTTFVTLQFHNGETLNIPSNSKVLRLFSYFEPLLDDQLDMCYISLNDHIPDRSPDHIPDSESEPDRSPDHIPDSESEPESELIPVPAPCTRTSFINIYNAVSKTANTHSRSDIMFMFNRFILNDDDKFIMNDSVSVDDCFSRMMDNCFRRLCVEADMLGLRQDRLQRLLEAVNGSQDILSQNKNMWDAMALEWKCRTSDNATTRNACLVNLDDVSPILRTCPPECTSSRNINWLFGGIDSKLGRVQARSRPSWISEPSVMDESLTVAEMSKQLHKSLPPEVLALLRLGAGKLVLAGGAALGHVVTGMEKTHRDYDIFLVGMDDEAEAESMVAEIERLNAGKIIRTRHAMNIVSMVGPPLVIQVIMSMIEDIATLILNFDIAPSRVAISYNPTSDALEVLCAPTFIEAVRSTMFFVELDFWGIGGLNRVMKYVFKGFNSAVPGHRRTQMLRYGEKCTRYYVGTSNRIAAGRLDGLFAAESLVMHERMGVINDTRRNNDTRRLACWDVLRRTFVKKLQFLSDNEMHAPLTPFEMKQITSLCMGRSDYEGYIRSLNVFVYSLRSMICRILGRPRRIEKNHVGILKFSRYRRHGMFYPIDPAVNEVYIPLEVNR
eukprot:gene9874-7758_t